MPVLTIDYQVQERPVTIISKLKSQVLVAGECLTLHCNASLSSKSTVLLDWRRNGQRIKKENKYNVSMFINGNYISSELGISNISLIDAGDYECLALDGVRGDGSAVFITASNNASVKVLGMFHIYLHVMTAHCAFADRVIFTGMVTVEKNIGQHIELPCNISHIENVTWQKDNLQLSTHLVSIRLIYHGNLLLFNIS